MPLLVPACKVQCAGTGVPIACSNSLNAAASCSFGMIIASKILERERREFLVETVMLLAAALFHLVMYGVLCSRASPIVFCVHGNKWGMAQCCETLTDDALARHCHEVIVTFFQTGPEMLMILCWYYNDF